METILDRMAERVVLWDGAMGTELYRAGLDAYTPPELWNLDRPEAVAVVHQAYYDAGADVAQTNTFGANRVRLARARAEDRVYQINRSAADLARGVCPPGRFVAGSLGPTGLFTSRETAASASSVDGQSVFRVALEGLLAGGVDLISIETMTGLDEALRALRAARRMASWPVAVSMTFRRLPSGFQSFWNEPADLCVRALADHGADIIGANCVEADDAASLAGWLRPFIRQPILIQPHAGQPVRRGGRYEYPHAADAWAGAVAPAQAAGARALGGCCGTTPEFIAALRRILSS